MAVLLIPYKSLKHTLGCLKDQVIDSIPYVSDYIPDTIYSPEDLFYFLRSITTYKNDPKGRELLQTLQTMMERNGYGDCDCFTIATLASNYYLRFGPQFVNLVGNERKGPSHIYSSVYDKKRNLVCAMDLTNPYYNTERKYAYIQTLDFKI
jgi:hypothetical protein